MECIYVILDKETGKADATVSRVWDYVGYEADNLKWKLAQFLEALGVANEGERSGEFDPADHCVLLDGMPTKNTVGTLVKLRIKADSFEGEYKGKISSVLLHPSNRSDDGGSAGSASSDDDPFS
jgi:hypothetical protein